MSVRPSWNKPARKSIDPHSLQKGLAARKAFLLAMTQGLV
jgi:hypothetical protein